MSELDCLESGKPDPPCEGAVELRHALSGSGVPYPRCDHHWRLRVAKQHEMEQRYPDSPHAPDWFDPTYAGERWDEDD